MLRVSRTQAVNYRLAANNLSRRLSAGSYIEAAYVGLQDTAPRDALLGLHARVDACETSAWEHPGLMQTYSPRAAVYVLPREDFGIFTVGRLPRDPAERQALEDQAERFCRELAGRPVRGCKGIVRSARPAGSRSAGPPTLRMSGSVLARRSIRKRLGSSSAAATSMLLVRRHRQRLPGGPGSRRGMPGAALR
jgi:hypothetical protein